MNFFSTNSDRNLFRWIALLIFIPLTSACTKEKANVMDEIKLTNGNAEVTFVMPAAYKAKADTDALMIVHCRYPGMAAADREKAPAPDSMAIHVAVSENPSRTDFLVKNAAKEYDPDFPAKEYFVGEDGVFLIYRAFLGKEPDSSEVVTYVFKGEDGALVGVEDLGAWAIGFTAHRKLGLDLNIHYFIPRALGRNFVEIDKKVVGFIKSHIKEQYIQVQSRRNSQSEKLNPLK